MINCDFCFSPLKQDYHPIKTRRCAVVSVCDNCGLYQTEYLKKDYKSQPPGSMSCDADRSSFRYTKSLVKNKYSDYIKKSNLLNAQEILDIGSNRGAFINYLEENFNENKTITAIEPHLKSCSSYKEKKNINLKIGRIENIEILENFYDFAYCVHTLEHVWSARNVLIKIFKSLKLGGNFLLSVPKLESYKDVVEELFIDPHTFHFTEELLKDFLIKIGFEIIISSENKDPEIIFLLKKNREFSGEKKYHPSKIVKSINARNLLIDYQKNLNNNRKSLLNISRYLEDLSVSQKIILWGSGRIFDALISIGKLRPSKNIVVYDTFLSVHVKELKGFKIKSPKNIKKINPDTNVFILSRAFAPEIKKKVLSLGYSKIKIFSEIM